MTAARTSAGTRSTAQPPSRDNGVMSEIVDSPGQSTADTDESELISLLRRLVEIDSSNPDLGSTGRGEAAVADFITEWLAPRGCDIARLEATPGRPSIVATWRGSEIGRASCRERVFAVV